jgi:hypothetical protein
MTLNETLSLEAAEHLAKRMSESGKGDDKAAIAHGFHLCTSRQPTVKESRVLLSLLNQQRANTAPDTLAPMTTVARALLNLDETITKE